MSKNQPTMKHLRLACRHVGELMAAGVTENHAIRTLELLTDVYAKLLDGGSASPNHINQVKLWSLAALRLRRAKPKATSRPRDYFRVEHGTPRRALAREVIKLYHKRTLDVREMNRLVKKYWKLAVITLDEDRRLNKIARSKLYKTPEERWKAAGIKFPAISRTRAMLKSRRHSR